MPKYYNFHYSTNYATVQANGLPAPSGIQIKATIISTNAIVPGLIGQVGTDWAFIAWDFYSGALSYSITASTSISGPFVSFQSASNSYNITSLAENTTIYVSITAEMTSGAQTFPSAPLVLTPNNYPDLIVTAINVEYASPFSHFNVSATVQNIGNGPTKSPILVFFELDANPGSYLLNQPQYTGSLQPGQAILITGNSYFYGGGALWTATPGVHTIKAVVNPFPPGSAPSEVLPDSNLVEYNYTNNLLFRDVFILPDLAISSVSTNPTSPSPGTNERDRRAEEIINAYFDRPKYLRFSGHYQFGASFYTQCNIRPFCRYFWSGLLQRVH